jgi:hypothetical protein
MAIADPGPNAVGFEIGACLPGGGMVLQKPLDQALRASGAADAVGPWSARPSMSCRETQ